PDIGYGGDGMKNRMQMIALVVSLLCLPAFSQNEKKGAPKPSPSPSQAVIDSWNDIARKLIAMAEDFPEDKYDFRPSPEERTFAEQLLHAAGSTYYFTNALLGKPMPSGDPKREQYKTKADLVAFVKKSFADGADALKARGDKGMQSLLTDSGSNQQYRVIDGAYGFVEHSGEHYGQLVVYYRVAGMV